MPVLIFWLLEGKSEGILEYSNISPVQTELETKQSNFHLAWIYIYHLWPLQLEIVWLCLNLQALYSAALKPLFRLLEWLRQFSVTCLIKFQTAAARMRRTAVQSGKKVRVSERKWSYRLTAVKSKMSANLGLSPSGTRTLAGFTKFKSTQCLGNSKPVFQKILWTLAPCLHLSTRIITAPELRWASCCFVRLCGARV